MTPNERQLWRERIARALASLKNDDFPAQDDMAAPAPSSVGFPSDSRREPNQE